MRWIVVAALVAGCVEEGTLGGPFEPLACEVMGAGRTTDSPDAHAMTHCRGWGVPDCQQCSGAGKYWYQCPGIPALFECPEVDGVFHCDAAARAVEKTCRALRDAGHVEGEF